MEVSQTFMPDEKRSDHALIEATRNGDEAAFGEIMTRYRGPITNYLFRFLNDYEEAVDLAQETFVRVYFALDRYYRHRQRDGQVLMQALQAMHLWSLFFSGVSTTNVMGPLKRFIVMRSFG